jgi:DNA-binding response OmpR family regulator
MDLSLPGMDGWEVTSRLKGDSRTRHLKVIALTAHALDGERERAAAAGCEGFITKPCLLDELIERVRGLLALPPAPESERPSYSVSLCLHAARGVVRGEQAGPALVLDHDVAAETRRQGQCIAQRVIVCRRSDVIAGPASCVVHVDRHAP